MLYGRIIEAGRGRGNWGHVGRKGKIGGSAPSTAGSSASYSALVKRPGKSLYSAGDPKAFKALRIGDVGVFSNGVEGHITGVFGKMFSVERIRAGRDAGNYDVVNAENHDKVGKKLLIAFSDKIDSKNIVTVSDVI